MRAWSINSDRPTGISNPIGHRRGAVPPADTRGIMPRGHTSPVINSWKNRTEFLPPPYVRWLTYMSSYVQQLMYGYIPNLSVSPGSAIVSSPFFVVAPVNPFHKKSVSTRFDASAYGFYFSYPILSPLFFVLYLLSSPRPPSKDTWSNLFRCTRVFLSFTLPTVILLIL